MYASTFTKKIFTSLTQELAAGLFHYLTYWALLDSIYLPIHVMKLSWHGIMQKYELQAHNHVIVMTDQQTFATRQIIQS